MLVFHVHSAAGLPELGEDEFDRHYLFKLFLDGDEVYTSNVVSAKTEPSWNEFKVLPPQSAEERKANAAPRVMFVEVWERDALAESNGTPDTFLGFGSVAIDEDTIDMKPHPVVLLPHPAHRAVVKIQGTVLVSVQSLPKKPRTVEAVADWVGTIGFSKADTVELQSEFRFHFVNSRVMESLSMTGVDLQRYGITNVTHCATLAIEWRKLKTEYKRVWAEVSKEKARIALMQSESSQALTPEEQEEVEDEEEQEEEEEEEEEEQKDGTKKRGAVAAFRRFIGSITANLLDTNYEFWDEEYNGPEGILDNPDGAAAAEDGSSPEVPAGDGEAADGGAAEAHAPPPPPEQPERQRALRPGLSRFGSSDLEHYEDEEARRSRIEAEAVAEIQSDDLIMARAEVVESEKTFVKNMTTLVECFHRPLQLWIQQMTPEQQAEVMTQDELDQLFGKVTMILEVNRSLLRDLSSEYFLGGNLGQVFLKFAPILKLYCSYVEMYETTVLPLVPEMRTRPLLDAFLRCAELQGRCGGTPLQRFLSLPVHRIPQYCLLLREVVKHTPKDEGDPRYQSLCEAFDTISDVAAFINESLRRSSRLQRETELRDEWRFDLMDGAARQLVREDTADKVYPSGNTSSKRVLLLSDMLVYGDEVGMQLRSGGQLYVLRRTFALRNAMALDANSQSEPEMKSQVKMVKQLGLLNVLDDLDRVSFVLITPESAVVRFRMADEYDKNGWIEDLRRCIAETNRLGDSTLSPRTDPVEKRKKGMFGKIRSLGKSNSSITAFS